MTRSNVQLGGQELKLDADGDTSIQVSSDDVLVIDTAGSERMQIDASGRVGIGITPDTTSNGKSLQINRSIINDDDGGSTHITQNGYYNSAWKYVEDGTAEKISFVSGTIRFDNASSNSSGADASLSWSERMRIDTSGNVIIGSTTSPTGASDCLVVSATDWDAVNDTGDTDVTGILIGANGRIFSQIDGNATGIESHLVNNIHSSGATCSLIQYRTLNSEEGSLTGNSSGLTINNVSDYRKKERITDLTGSIDVIKTLKPREYYYRKEFGKPTRAYAGFIAHEVQDSLLPHMTNGVKDGVVTKENKENGEHHDMDIGDPVYQTVAYGDNELITRLVGAVQELSAKVETLEAEVAKLKG